MLRAARRAAKVDHHDFCPDVVSRRELFYLYCSVSAMFHELFLFV